MHGIRLDCVIDFRSKLSSADLYMHTMQYSAETSARFPRKLVTDP